MNKVFPRLEREQEAISKVVEAFASATWRGDTAWLHLPLIYPSGTSVTLKVTPSPDGLRVSDGGCAFREVQGIGAEGSFPRVSGHLAKAVEVERNAREVFATTHLDGLFRAVCDVGTASWQIVEKIYEAQKEQDEVTQEDQLRDRLYAIFGRDHVETDCAVTGASTTEWNVTALVTATEIPAVFQAVDAHADAIYRTAAAFHDLADLPVRPTLTAVVKSKAAFGPKLRLLGGSGSVIEAEQSDAAYKAAIDRPVLDEMSRLGLPSR